MNTPMRVGDRVESGAYGPGTVEGFGFCEGEGEHGRVLFDSDIPAFSHTPDLGHQ